MLRASDLLLGAALLFVHVAISLLPPFPPGWNRADLTWCLEGSSPPLAASLRPSLGHTKPSALTVSPQWSPEASLQQSHRAGAAAAARLHGSLRWQQIALCSMPGSFPVSILVVSGSALLPASTPYTDSPNWNLSFSQERFRLQA